MTNLRKYKDMNKERVRISTYIPSEMARLMTEETNRRGLTESAFLRELVFLWAARKEVTQTATDPRV